MKCRNLSILFMANFVIASCAHAQWTTLTNTNTIRRIAEDRATGDIWFATSGGAIKLKQDQINLPVPSFELFTNIDGLSTVDLNAVVSDEEGNLFFGTRGEGVFIVFGNGVKKSFDVLDGVPNDNVFSIKIAGRSVWVGTVDGTREMRLSQNFLDPFSNILLVNRQVRDIATQGEVIWFATSDGLYRREANSVLTRFAVGDGLLSNSVNSLKVKNQNEIYVGTEAGIQILDSEVGRFTDFLMGLDTIDSRNVRAVELFDGLPWIVTEDGIYRLDDNMWIDESTNLLSRNLLSLAVSSSNEILVGTNRLGLAIREGEQWKNQEFPGPVRNDVTHILVDSRDVLWTSSTTGPKEETGLSRFDGRIWTTFTSTNSPLIINLVSSINEAPDSSIWLGSFFGPTVGTGGFNVLIDNGTPAMQDDIWETYTADVTPLPAGVIRGSIVFDENGDAWVGSLFNRDLPGGLVKFISDTGEFENFSDRLTERQVNDLIIDKQDNLWIGLVFSGMDVLHRSAAGDSVFHVMRSGAGLVGTQINDFAIDSENRLWIVSNEKVVRLNFNDNPMDQDNFVFEEFSPFQDQSFIATGIEIQDDRFVWFSSSQGAFRLDLTDNIYKSFNTQNSDIASDDVRDVFVDRDRGNAWFATSRGISRLSLLSETPSLLRRDEIVIAPNPFRPGRDQFVSFVPVEPNSSTEVFTISGKRVFGTLSEDAQGNVLNWDGKNNDSELVPGGIYIVITRNGKGKIRTGKLAILR